MTDSATDVRRPWYREFWVWVLILLPASAVVGGITTVVIANTHPDSLVVDDFQKVGLVAKRETPRDREAGILRMDATISIDRDSGRVIVRLDGDSRPDELVFSIHHPTRADFDRRTLLKRDDSGVYRGNIGGGVNGHWYVQLASGRDTPDNRRWRMTGRLPDIGNLVEITGKQR